VGFIYLCGPLAMRAQVVAVVVSYDPYCRFTSLFLCKLFFSLASHLIHFPQEKKASLPAPSCDVLEVLSFLFWELWIGVEGGGP